MEAREPGTLDEHRAAGNIVRRWVVTMKKDATALRTLALGAQGRYTFATREEAQSHLRAMLANNADDTLRSVYGDTSAMDVRECECWAGHFDPVGVYFDDKPAPAPVKPPPTLGIPYAFVDPASCSASGHVRICPICRERIAETSDEYGEETSDNYGAHYAKKHAGVKPRPVRVTLTADDVSELYFMLRTRGDCVTRRKLLAALRKLDPKMARELGP